MSLLKGLFKRKKAVVKKSNAPGKLEILLADALWLFAVLACIFLTLCLISYADTDPAWSKSTEAAVIQNMGGIFGAYFADILYYIFGYSSWWLLFTAFTCLVKTYRSLADDKNKGAYHFGLCLLGLVLSLISSPVLERVLLQKTYHELPQGAGGGMGASILMLLQQSIGQTGTILFSIVLLIIGFSLVIQTSWLDLIEKLGAQAERLFLGSSRVASSESERLSSTFLSVRSRIVRQLHTDKEQETLANNTPKKKKRRKTEIDLTIQPSLFEEDNRDTPPPKITVAGSSSFPGIDLLQDNTQVQKPADPEKLQQTAKLIESKLAEFGVGIKVVGATAGPVITRYEVEPQQGVKGAQIVNLSKDLARVLSMQSVRVVETIAGKSSMGIELPNEDRLTVYMSDILKSPVFQKSTSTLTLALGKDISGNPVIADLAKMPHLLVAGTTGSGKSVAINTMIVSLVYKASPEEVRLIMVDPKMLELSVYQDIPHLLAPVVTDMAHAANALSWCVQEMEKRYRLLAHVGVRNLAGYNQKITDAQKTNMPIPNPFSLNKEEPEPLGTLPQIVVIIDELADLMMVEGKKVEQFIARLAQKARACGIHLILATQRPSVDVITGLIKANIPTRMSFQVSSKIDSRTILDQMGAENLLGMGDMLFLPPGTGDPARIHGAFISDEEVHNVVDFLKSQGEPQYIEGLLTGQSEAETGEGGNGSNGGDRAEDELFDAAVAFVLETRKTSISSLQRHLRIGYNRSANLMDALERAGIVSPAELGGSRKILARVPHD